MKLKEYKLFAGDFYIESCAAENIELAIKFFTSKKSAKIPEDIQGSPHILEYDKDADEYAMYKLVCDIDLTGEQMVVESD